ncbi:MAG: ABC transporter permease [Bacillota bacterium]
MSKKRVTRLLEYLFTVWVIVTLNFALPRIMPGDPFLYISSGVGEHVQFTEEQRAYYIEYYGLDQPVDKQYLSYLFELTRGNLGYSLYYHEPVSSIILRRLGWTLLLVVAAVVLSTIIGVVLGSISAWYREKKLDQVLFFCLIVLSEIPAFLLGLILLFTLAVGLGLFPLSGAMTHFAQHGSWWAKVLDILRHAFLPVMALTIARIGGMYLLSRNSVTTVLEKDYLRTARAKGLSKARILYRHVIRNAMLPIVTRVFLSLGSLVGGAILVENVFAYPGLGLLIREAVMVRDYPLIQGIFLVVTVFVLGANFIADTLYGKLDPRVKDYSKARGV